MTQLQEIKEHLQSLADKQIAAHSQRYFKTGKGEYAEGDIFLGIRVPVLRKVAKQYPQLSLKHIQSLLKSKIHEHRLLALIMLVNQYQKTDSNTQDSIIKLYLNHTKYINNWDLVDTSAAHIVGAYLYNKNRDLLYELVNSENIWERRISVLSCFYFIRHNDYDDAIKIAEKLLNDSHDLIHKAVGWMLRETGKKNPTKLNHFLDKYAAIMPRTMLRYALEKLPPKRRQYYMVMKPGPAAQES